VAKPLDPANFRFVLRELDQIGVAVSVVGTKRPMLLRLAGYAEGIRAALVGSRPEVRKARDELARLIQGVRSSSPKAKPASKAIRKLHKGVLDVQRIVSKGLGVASAVTEVGGFELDNAWGYTSFELRTALSAIKKADAILRRAGLESLVKGVVVVLDPEVAAGSYASYDRDIDLMAMDPGQDQSGDTEAILRALGGRLWATQFKPEDKEVWGGGRDPGRFSDAFSRKLAGESVDRDTAARLQVTVGRLAKRWPKAA
jgi:hypothetical protein